MRESLLKTLEDLSDDESPTHGFGTVVKNFLVTSASTAFECFMRLFEYDRHENLTRLLTMIVRPCAKPTNRRAQRKRFRRHSLRSTDGISKVNNVR